MTIFYTSDGHLGHVRIIDLCHRPFRDVHHMNWMLIKNWNTVVRPSDTVIHLGDVALGVIAESLPLVGKLNGHKVLVPGNHDRIFSGESDAKRERFMPMYQEVFQEIWPEQAWTKIGGRDVLLCHFPYRGDSQDHDRHVDKRPKDEGFPLVHGHIHEKRCQDGRMINVGVDVWDFMPVHEDQLAVMFDSVLSD